ncbi:cytochrome P450 [Fomitiporia mediterranea MF3/22]|uniref:cytochrome P450 n=1 Tax=Fomitiporia mediterranea (strain MF3/22) TaxID=694068 RepID=UPI0004407717|nr:cytochrome P450 [Fomitiporia mediterranea MF3/22]EJD00067.1 cytochrome P450 [Fomitiporia mediterranea MF3/22]
MSTLNATSTESLRIFSIDRGIKQDVVFTGAVIVLFSAAVQYLQAKKKHVNVPAIGPSGTLTSYFGALRLVKHAREMLDEGYRKCTTFKIPMFDRWMVVVNTPELIEEVRRAPDDKLSFMESTEESLAVKYTLGPYVSGNHYHVALVRSQLTRNLGVMYHDIQEEVAQAFEDTIATGSNEWITLPALDTIMKVVVRASNRVFVGLPLCREKEYLELNIRFTLDVIKGSAIINMFPNFLKGLVGEFLTSVPASTRKAMKHLGPVIEYRLAQADKYGKDWPGKPNDMLTWLLEEAPENERRNVKALTQRILTLNFAAVHTSSTSFTHALLHVASNPEDIRLLREEVEHVVKEEGWSKDSLSKMARVDSYIKEALRYSGIGLLSMSRKALVDYTMSDGTFLPAGTFVTVNAVAQHYDEKNYKSPSEFDGFRFVDALGKSENEETTARVVSTSTEFLPFGHGRHACPGRFFAANELKTMLAHLVLNYDMKLEGDGTDPKQINFITASIPNPKARVLFKKRQT